MQTADPSIMGMLNRQHPQGALTAYDAGVMVHMFAFCYAHVMRCLGPCHASVVSSIDTFEYQRANKSDCQGLRQTVSHDDWL